jgi:cytochrome c nitrite reductase small subunit
MKTPRFLILLIAAAIGTLAGAGAYTFHYAEGTSYLSNNPAACVNCHIMREHYEAWQRSTHHAVATCNDCHVLPGFPEKYVIKAQQGWRHSVAFTFGGFHEPILIKKQSARIVRGNCLRCHGDLVNTIRAYHAPGSEDVSCVTCHRGVGHGPSI